MYIPRGKLLALVTIVVAASLVTATGAFSSVTAERTTEVKVANDANAFLALDGNTDGGNGEYVSMDQGKLSIDLTTSSEGAQGVNPDAVTTFDNLFTITNQGSQPVNLELTPKGDHKEAIKFYDENGETVSERENIEPGTSIKVGIKVDTREGNYGNETKLLDNIVIKATSPDANENVVPDDVGNSSGDSENKNARLAAPA